MNRSLSNPSTRPSPAGTGLPLTPGDAPSGQEIAYQRFYNPMYLAAYDGLIKTGALGEVYHTRLAWHRNGNWRRKGEEGIKA